ncbi:MAG: hypothetical protein JW995_02955 [Melioribacteraceae bacterium]|nr:hypothetical protein [Melioribacteraceae bacterium]
MKTVHFGSEITITFNAPSPYNFDPLKPVYVVIYALPNGNTTDQTIGKIIDEGDDWHYDIQHIGAQTRFLRSIITDYNLIVAYVENKQQSWTVWKNVHPDNAFIVASVVDSIRSIFNDFSTTLVLSGHSGGGGFIFSYLDAYNKIPSFVKRISFLDSNYGYEKSYFNKIKTWLKDSNNNTLFIAAYNDSVALYNGQSFVSDTGGTWYRSKLMKNDLSKYFDFNTVEDTDFIMYRSKNGKVQILLKKNPERIVLHTVQVELNGFIHSMLSGTVHENKGYTYFGERAYSEWIQKNIDKPECLRIPERRDDLRAGSEFMRSVRDLSFEERELIIFEEVRKGNIPEFLRTLIKIKSVFYDADSNRHIVEYEVMPDYLAIGSDTDYCRIPLGPLTAQKIADLFGASMPTRKLVNNIFLNADIKLPPITYYPDGNKNESVKQFVRHNNKIQNQLDSAGAKPGQLIAGIKKDVVLSNKISDAARPNHVTIYGWHYPTGNPIQPLTNIHVNWYVDYSHGVRLINNELLIDRKLYNYKDVLTDPNLYKIFSDESEPMKKSSYLK